MKSLALCARSPSTLMATTPLAAQRQCQMQCLVRLQQCKKHCVDNCRNCLNKAYYKSVRHYSRYVHDIMLQGGTIVRDLNSYRDPLQCRKITCSCPADYNACSQLCGGIIRKQLSSASYCSGRF
jgi:hypothetical protein